MADGDAGHDDGFRTDPDIVADDCVAGRLEGIVGRGEFGCIGDEGEGEGRDPVVPVALIARHDEGGARADGAEGADNEPVDAGCRHQVAGAVVKGMAVIIARIIAVAADNDVGIGDLAVERDAQERAFEEIGHDCSMEGAPDRRGCAENRMRSSNRRRVGR